MKRVRVYRNLTACRTAGRTVYSVMNKATGLVIAHMENVALANPKFVVNAGGRARVLKALRKNVHAFVDGELVTEPVQFNLGETFERVSYNPYKGPDFVRGDGSAVKAAFRAFLGQSGVFIR